MTSWQIPKPRGLNLDSVCCVPQTGQHCLGRLAAAVLLNSLAPSFVTSSIIFVCLKAHLKATHTQ